MVSAILLRPIITITALLFTWCLFTEFLKMIGLVDERKK
jgi:hypothetical protein